MGGASLVPSMTISSVAYKTSKREPSEWAVFSWIFLTRVNGCGTLEAERKDREWVKQNEETTSYRHRRTDGSRKNEDGH